METDKNQVPGSCVSSVIEKKCRDVCGRKRVGKRNEFSTEQGTNGERAALCQLLAVTLKRRRPLLHSDAAAVCRSWLSSSSVDL